MSAVVTSTAPAASRRLAHLALCSWPSALLEREAIAAAEAAAAAHAGPAFAVRTCQRIEVVTLRGADCDCPAPAHRRGGEALRHLAAVAAGLHSAVLGEPQVLGQVRRALAHVPRPLRPYATIALAAARELRREAGFTADSGHLLDLGLACGRQPAGGRLLVLGTGAVARLVARRATALGFTEVVHAGRQRPDGCPAERFLPLSGLATAGRCDVVASCLSADAPAIDVARLPRARLVLDFGSPPVLRGGGVVSMADILRNDGAGDARAGYEVRLAAILDRRLEMAARDATSAVGRLRLEVERVREREAVRIERLHPGIPRQTIDQITRSLVNQLFHRPSQHLATLADPDLARHVVELFAASEPVRGHDAVNAPALMEAE